MGRNGILNNAIPNLILPGQLSMSKNHFSEFSQVYVNFFRIFAGKNESVLTRIHDPS